MNKDISNNLHVYLNSYLQKKSEKDLLAFFDEISGLLYRVSWTYLKNEADVEDLLQSCFIKIIENVHKCQGLKDKDNEAVKSWCVAIVRNLSRMKLRSRKSRKSREETISSRIPKFVFDESDVFKEEIKKEVFDKIQEALIDLPENYRVPIHLKFIEGMDYKEIAKIMDLNASTLRVTVKRGLEKMSSSLKKLGVVASVVSLSLIIPEAPLRASPINVNGLVGESLEVILKSKSTTMISSIAGKILFGLMGVIVLMAVLYYDPFELLVDGSMNNENTQQYKLLEKEWSFRKGFPNDMKPFHFDAKYDKKYKGVSAKFNKPFVLKLPIPRDVKMFYVDIMVSSAFLNKVKAYYEVIDGKKTLMKDFKLGLSGLLAINEVNFEGTEYVLDYYTINKIIKEMPCRIYFINNLIFVEIEGICRRMTVYDSFDVATEKIILVSNYMIFDMKLKELKKIPKELKTLYDKREENCLTKFRIGGGKLKNISNTGKRLIYHKPKKNQP